MFRYQKSVLEPCSTTKGRRRAPLPQKRPCAVLRCQKRKTPAIRYQARNLSKRGPPTHVIMKIRGRRSGHTGRRRPPACMDNKKHRARVLLPLVQSINKIKPPPRDYSGANHGAGAARCRRSTSQQSTPRSLADSVASRLGKSNRVVATRIRFKTIEKWELGIGTGDENWELGIGIGIGIWN